MNSTSELLSALSAKKAVKKEKAKSKELKKRRIPKAKLENALKLLKNDDEMNLVFRQSNSCIPPIHVGSEHETLLSPMMLALKDMRKCLMQRDFRGLAGILSLTVPNTLFTYFLCLMVKYGTILTAYTDEKLMSILTESVILQKDPLVVLKRSTQYPNLASDDEDDDDSSH